LPRKVQSAQGWVRTGGSASASYLSASAFTADRSKVVEVLVAAAREATAATGAGA